MFACDVSCCLFAVICLWASFADARTWTFRDGSAPVEAELLDVAGGIVRLQLANGEVAAYHKSVLQDADRRFVDDWVSAEEGIPLKDGVQFNAKLYWETMHYVGDSLPPHGVLVVLLNARGKEAAAATRYSDLKIDEAVGGDGAPLLLSADSMGDLRKPVDLKRYGNLEQPRWGFKLKLIYSAPLKPIGSIRRLRGSMRITTGRPQPITVDQVGAIKNRRIDDGLLCRAGLTATENPERRSAGVFYSGPEKRKQFVLQISGPRQRVFSVEMLDAGGTVIEHFLGRSASGGWWKDELSGRKSEATTYQFDLDSTATTNPRMRITVLEDAHEVLVPFELVDLKIAQRKVRADKGK